MVTGGDTASAHTLIGDPAPSGPCSSASPNVAVRVPAPTYCLMTQPDDTKVKLTWDLAAGKSFFVYYGTAQDILKATKFVDATGMDVTVTGLINGTKYYFWLVAGKFPNVVSNIATATPVTVPEAPTGLTATAGNTQVSLSWTAPRSDGGSRISGYVIYKGTSPGAETGSSVNGSLITATSYTVTGLTNGTTYYFTVTAVNRIGAGPASSEAPATLVTTPGAPTGLTATPGNAQVALSWAAPASNGGSAVTGYDLYVGTTADLNGSTPIARVTSTVVTVTRLTNGTTYYFKVAAVNRIGAGAASSEAQATLVTTPGAPTGLTATPGNAQVTLSWAAPASGDAPISGYLIYQGNSPGREVRNPINGSLVTATSYTVTGLTNGTTYYFRVIAVNTAGQGLSSAEALATLRPIVSSSAPATNPTSSTTTPPATHQKSASTTVLGAAAPIWLTATPGNTQVRLSWTAPASDGGSSAIGYKVYLATHPGMQAGAAIGTTKSTDATVAGLANGTAYYFMVAEVDAAGNESLLSAQVSAEPTSGPTVPMSMPGPPKQLIALLAAAGAMAVAGALTLIARHRRRFRSRRAAHSARSREQMAMAQDVRAVPETFRVDAVKVDGQLTPGE
jgi:predicted phage tail protein